VVKTKLNFDLKIKLPRRTDSRKMNLTLTSIFCTNWNCIFSVCK